MKLNERAFFKLGSTIFFLISLIGLLSTACKISAPPDTKLWKCTNDQDCISGLFCSKGLCLTACTDKEDCQKALEEKCIKNLCMRCAPGTTKKCYTGPKGTSGKGICKEGKQTCSKELTWGACLDQIKPATRKCNGKDDNCDGKIDTGCECAIGKVEICYTGPKGTNGKGICKAGQKTCKKGNWGKCLKQVHPSSETCSGKDNDCNGKIDDNIGSGNPCKRKGAKGACADGIFLCIKGKPQCKQLHFKKAEDCNGLDDNCDGYIDNALGKKTKSSLVQDCYSGSNGCSWSTVRQAYTCRKPCTIGIRRCTSVGDWSNFCVGEKLPLKEGCNGKDEDCDGIVDNQAQCPTGKKCSKGRCQ